MKSISVWLLIPILPLSAAEKKPSVERPPSTPARIAASPALPPILYRPPKVGLPKVTAACGTRDEGKRFELTVLAPPQEAWTARESPILFWHQSGPSQWPLEATVVIPGQPDPVLQVRLEAEGEWHRLNLEHHQVRLKPGVTYQWAVTAVVDPAQRSKDLVAEGVIRRVQPADDLAERLARLSATDRIRALALTGYWYDAVAALAAQLEQSPANLELQQWCGSLCEQGGLGPLVIDQ